MARLAATITLALAHTTATVVTATAYSPCSSGTTMADGHTVHWGAVAANWLRLGTHIRLWPPVLGRTHFTVQDRIGYGSSLDIWMPSCAGAIVFGRRVERVTILR